MQADEPIVVVVKHVNEVGHLLLSKVVANPCEYMTHLFYRQHTSVVFVEHTESIPDLLLAIVLMEDFGHASNEVVDVHCTGVVRVILSEKVFNLLFCH